MENDVVIRSEGLGKRYMIGHQSASEPYVALRDVVVHKMHRLGRTAVDLVRGRPIVAGDELEEFWALKDVSFDIKRGEVTGVIGPNGAGKSTLLKILSRITEPSEGRVTINGRVASLLEVGTGFHPELTGRENIFLNGAILGMTKKEIKGRFDEIVAFAEIEKFLDTPVKRYSSGMYVRLAFAVAAHLEPEILIVDEVLAVGDAAFQKKCLGKMGSFAQSGRTVLFVSHNMEAVRTLCHRCVWLRDGRLHKDGKADEIIEAYFNSISNELSFSSANPDFGLIIQKVVLKNDRGEESSQFHPGEDLIVEISYDAQKRLEQPYVVLGVQGISGSCFTANMLLDGHRPDALAGTGKLSCRFKSLPLFPQNYSVKMSVRTRNGKDMIVNYQEVAYFSVVGDLAEYGYKGEFVFRAANSTPVVVPYEWCLPDGTIANVSLAHPLK